MKINIPPDINQLSACSTEKSLKEIEKQSNLSSLVPMAWGESSWGPSPKVVRALRNELLTINRYPENGYLELKKLLAAKHGIQEEEVAIGAGIGHLTELLVRGFVREGDEVISSIPSHVLYHHLVKVRSARSVQVPLKDMQHDLGAIRRSITERTRLVILDTPSRSIGNTIDPPDMYRFLSDVPENVIVVFDGNFLDYVEESRRVDVYSLICNTENRCGAVFLQSFSALYGLAGLRIGYGMMDSSISDVLEKVRTPFTVNRMAIAAALAALEDGEYYDDVKRKTIEERQFLQKKLVKAGVSVVRGEANFLLVHCGGNADQMAETLLRLGTAVRSMTSAGFKEHIRVTVGKRGENEKFFKEFIECRSALGYG